MESIGFDVLTHPHTQKPPRNIKANNFDDSGAPPWLERAQAPRCSHRIRNQSLAQPTATRRQHGFGSHTSSGCTSTYQPPSQKHAASKLLSAISFQRSKPLPISPKHIIYTQGSMTLLGVIHQHMPTTSRSSRVNCSSARMTAGSSSSTWGLGACNLKSSDRTQWNDNEMHRNPLPSSENASASE